MLRRTSPGYCYYYYYHYHDNRTLHHWLSFPVLVHFVRQGCAGWEREFPQDSFLKELLSWSLFIWQEMQESESRATGESFEALPRHECLSCSHRLYYSLHCFLGSLLPSGTGCHLPRWGWDAHQELPRPASALQVTGEPLELQDKLQRTARPSLPFCQREEMEIQVWENNSPKACCSSPSPCVVCPLLLPLLYFLI